MKKLCTAIAINDIDYLQTVSQAAALKYFYQHYIPSAPKQGIFSLLNRIADHDAHTEFDRIITMDTIDIQKLRELFTHPNFQPSNAVITKNLREDVFQLLLETHRLTVSFETYEQLLSINCPDLIEIFVSSSRSPNLSKERTLSLAEKYKKHPLSLSLVLASDKANLTLVINDNSLMKFWITEAKGDQRYQELVKMCRGMHGEIQ